MAFRCLGVEATYSPRRQVGGSYRKLLESLASAACQRLLDQAGGRRAGGGAMRAAGGKMTALCEPVDALVPLIASSGSMPAPHAPTAATRAAIT